MSGINVDDVDHSSYLARLTLDKQQTAVLSSSVGKVISLQRLDCLILKPNFFCVSGNVWLYNISGYIKSTGVDINHNRG